MKPIVTIRPPKGCQATVAAGVRTNLRVTPHPMAAIVAREWDAPDPATVDALLIGSVNAIEQAGTQLALYKDKPVHTVGEVTAQAVRDTGMSVGIVGQGGLQMVLDALPEGEHRLLRLAAEKHVPLEAPKGVSMTLRIVYAAELQPIPSALEEVLRDGALVLLHSAETAAHFAEECARLQLDKSRIAIAALGPRILDAAGSGWAQAKAAPQPRDAALLALARDMWQ